MYNAHQDIHIGLKLTWFCIAFSNLEMFSNYLDLMAQLTCETGPGSNAARNAIPVAAAPKIMTAKTNVLFLKILIYLKFSDSRYTT